MPIRFRCAYCNQLLGIARRKAGQVVRCPTCAGQVIVPTPEEDEAAEPEPEGADTAAASVEEPLFERSDFDELLSEKAPVSSIASPPAPPPPRPPAPPPAPAAGPGNSLAFEVERERPSSAARPAPAAGIVLSPARATFLTVLGIILLAVAFGAGVLVGRLL
jgi:phage FluMu protein Com